MKAFARRYLADPNFKKFFDEEMDQTSRVIEMARAAPPPNSPEFPKLVEDLLSPDSLTHSVAKIRLEKSGANAEEALLAAFEHPRCVWTADGSSMVDSAPAGRVADLLFYIPSRRLGDRLANLVEHANWRISNRAIKARAALGRTELLPFVISNSRPTDPEST